MDEKVRALLDAAIRLELIVSDMYLYFSQIFPEDKALWWQLCLEEKDHASVVESGANFFVDRGLFPKDLLEQSCLELERTIEGIETQLDVFRKQSPSRLEALRTAVCLEESAGEFHYQIALEKKGGSKALEMFQRLNADDRDHADRIRTYMQEHNLQ